MGQQHQRNGDSAEPIERADMVLGIGLRRKLLHSSGGVAKHKLHLRTDAVAQVRELQEQKRREQQLLNQVPVVILLVSSAGPNYVQPGLFEHGARGGGSEFPDVARNAAAVPEPIPAEKLREK